MFCQADADNERLDVLFCSYTPPHETTLSASPTFQSALIESHYHFHIVTVEHSQTRHVSFASIHNELKTYVLPPNNVSIIPTPGGVVNPQHKMRVFDLSASHALNTGLIAPNQSKIGLFRIDALIGLCWDAIQCWARARQAHETG